MQSKSLGRHCKKIVSIFLIIAMIVTMWAPSVFALGDPWQGTAEGEVLIKDTVTKIADQVYEHEVITNNTQGNDQKIDYLLEVGKSDTIKIAACYGEDDASSWSLTPTTKQAAAYEKNHPGETVVAGINADFFNMATGQPRGALVMEGKIYNQANGMPYFGITKDGQAVIRTDSDLSDLETAVGGDAILINNGVPIDASSSYGELKYSRTAIGIKDDGTVITFVTHGLNAPVSCGRKYTEIAQMLAEAGCTWALALDGGGSSTYAARPEGSSDLTVRNSPADGAERAVSSSLLVVSTAEPTGIFDHAQLSPNNEVYTPGYEVKFEAQGVDTAGMAMELPEGLTWAVAEGSKDLGTIDENTGVFTAGQETGQVTVNLIYEGKVVGETTIEIATPDSIYFASEEISLGFEESSDLGVVVRNQGRDMNYKAGDIKWEITDNRMGSFEGNIFTSSDGESLTGTVTATSAYDAAVYGTITVIVGKLPTVVWDFEDVTDEEGGVTETAEDYYIGSSDDPGILSTSNYGRGGKESIEIVSIDDDEPVRFGEKALKLNYDFTACGEVTEGACIGTTEGLTVPGVPTAIGVWVYAPEGVGIEYEGEGSQAGFWLRGYVKDGNGSNQPYDFTFEPKSTPEGEQPGIYWEGWKYLEADLTKLQSPYSIQPGMTLRLMYVAGTKMGTKTANSIYFDNLQFVYGTNVDDIDEPYVNSLMINGEELEDGDVINESTLTVDAYLKDVENKYTSKIDDSTVRLYIDGINVVDNDKYMYAYSAGDDRAQVSDLKLKDGLHSVTVYAKDGFGNEVKETRYFTIDTGTAAATDVTVEPATETAVIGQTVDLQIRATDNTVTDSRTIFKLGNLFTDYEVKFSDNYTGDVTYSKLEKTITVNAERKADAAAEDGNLIATLSVKVPSNLKESDSFTYTVSGGMFETSQGGYDTYSTREITLPIDAYYKVSSDPVIVGGDPAEISVVNGQGEPAADVALYLAEGDVHIGNTDENGILTTDRFNAEGASAANYVIYAKDAEGGLSFEYTVSVYDPQGSTDGMPYNIRFNTVDDPASQKNITWFSYPLDGQKQFIKYAVSGTDEWITVEADTEQVEFNSGGNDVINVNSVYLKDLVPDTEYDYVLGTESVSTEADKFNTEAADKDTNEFFIIGDIQDPDKSRVEEVARQLDAENTDYDFGIQIGDAIDQAADYTDWSDLGEIVGAKMLGDTNMISIMGNHEYYGDPAADIAGAIYNNPDTDEGAYYSLEYGDLYIAVINFSNTATPIQKAADWLVEDAAKSDATWKILCMHQPPYYTNNGGNEPVYRAIPDAAEEAGIDAVFSGHDHTWAVTNPLIDDQIDEDNGILYYIVGAAGSKRYAPVTQDKFDYDTIFRRVGESYTATYLKVSSNKDEMTIEVYDIEKGRLDTVTLKSECMKNGHQNVYDPAAGTTTCSVCGEVSTDYTGEVLDKDGNEYYLLLGKVRTGWVSVGEEQRYYGENGVREKVTMEETPSTCIIDGFAVYTSESGATHKVEYIDAGGHEYEEVDGKTICSICGWEQFEMSEVNVDLSTYAVTYNGNTRRPYTSAVDPNGNVLTKPPTDYYDYYSSYNNDVEVGTATVTLTAAKYGFYVDMSQWRGNYKGSVTVEYEIRPTAPSNARLSDQGERYVLSWDAAPYADKAVDEYVIYQSVDGSEWKEIAATKDTSYELSLNDDSEYRFRVVSRKTVDGKAYESLTYTTAGALYLDVTAQYDQEAGKPTLKWSHNDGAEYTVLRSTSADGPYYAVFTTKGTTYTHVSAQPGKTYYYKVQATADGQTKESDVVSVTCPIAAPVIEKAELNANADPALAWSDVDGAVRYEVYRSAEENGQYELMFITGGTTYTNTTTGPGDVYFYKVKAVPAIGEGVFSEAVRIECPITAPVIEKAELNADNKPALAWKDIPKAAEYEVYRATDADGEYVKMFTTTGTTYTNTSAEDGDTYYYKVKVLFDNGESAFSDPVSVTCELPDVPVDPDPDDPGTEDPDPEEPGPDEPVVDDVQRYEGDNRYETATSVADAFKTALGIDRFDNVIIAYGDNYADALTGSYLSKVKNAPILLVNKYSEDYVKNYINDNVNAGGTIYILGGEGVISENFENSLSGYNVVRLGGANRYETNMNILREAGVNNEDILVCSAMSFADSLSASAVGKPILLVNDSLYEEQTAFLEEFGCSNFYLIGGASAVSGEVESQLKEIGTTERIAGDNRYETSKAVAEKFFPNGSSTLVIASGADFPDGLTGGPLAMLNSAPIILVNDKNTELARDFVIDSTVSKVIIVGGNGAVSDSAMDNIVK